MQNSFVSMLPVDDGQVFAVWLDGRYTKGGHDDKHAHGDMHHHGGAMTLRTANFDDEGKIYGGLELDDRVCDCCQTGVAMGADGPLVVYRDRLQGEIRDISIVRKLGDKWTKPALVHKDHWETKACPVNGPAIDAVGNQVVVAWYTMAGEAPRVLLASSPDNGASFEKPVRIDDGEPIGRVDVVLAGGYTYVSWIEKDAVWLAKLKSGQVLEKIMVDKTSSTRKSGFPIMKFLENHLYFVWTILEGETTRLKTVVINL